MREIVLDTETTGLEAAARPSDGRSGLCRDFNRMSTGQTLHGYINPERDVPTEAFDVHGLSGEFLADKPLFTHVVEDSWNSSAMRRW